MESFEGGPKQIVKETIQKLSHILSEMYIRIKVTSKIADSDDILFPWRTYQSMALHILLWSTNITSPLSCIYFDVNIDKIEDGAIV